MNEFENEYLFDDFEVEISDLEPGNGPSRISGVLAALRSGFSVRKQVSDSEDEVTEDDFEVEIRDLEPNNEHKGLLYQIFGNGAELPRVDNGAGKPCHYISFRMRIWRAAMAGMTFCLVILLLLMSMPFLRYKTLGLFARPTPTPAPSYVSEIAVGGIPPAYGNPRGGIIIIDGTPSIWEGDWNTISKAVPKGYGRAALAPVPQDCPQTATADAPSDLHSTTGTIIGASPLWVIGFTGRRATLNHLIPGKQPGFGWSHQITLLLETNVGLVTLSGGNVLYGSAIRFAALPPEQGRTTSLTLSPASSDVSNHTGADQEWMTLSSFIYLPAAGCYYLQASWPGGNWIVYFAAGR